VIFEHHADVLRPNRDIDTKQLFDREAVRMLVRHHRHVVETIHVRQRLDEGACLGELLGGAVKQADVRVGALDDLAVELKHEPEHAVGCRMLWPEVQGVVLDLSHYWRPP